MSEIKRLSRPAASLEKARPVLPDRPGILQDPDLNLRPGKPVRPPQVTIPDPPFRPTFSIWNGSAVPPGCTELSALPGAGLSIVLQWQSEASAYSNLGYEVWRAVVPAFQKETIPSHAGSRLPARSPAVVAQRLRWVKLNQVNTNCYEDLSVTEGAAYSYKVRTVFNTIPDSLASDYSTVVTCTCKGKAPQSGPVLTVCAAPEKKAMRLRWDALPDALGYLLFRRCAGETAFVPLNAEPVTRCEYLDDPCPAAEGSIVQYRAAAVNHWGQTLGAPVSARFDCPAPSCPTGFGYTLPIDRKVLELHWDPAQNAAGYLLQMDGAPLNKEPIPDCCYIPTAFMVAGKAYTFSLTACSVWGKSAPCTLKVLYNTPIPDAVEGLTLVSRAHDLQLCWQPAARAVSYQVTRLAPDLASFPESPATFYTEPSPVPSLLYTYQIDAVNAWSHSASTRISSRWVNPQPPANTRAIVITCFDRVQDSARYPTVEDCHNSCVEMFQAYGVPARSLLNASLDQVRQTIRSFFGSGGRDQQCYVWIYCHGSVSGLSLYCHQPDTGTDTGHLFYSDLRQLLDTVPGRKFVVIDSCNSGSSIQARSLRAPAVPADEEEICRAAISTFLPRTGSVLRSGELLGNDYHVLCSSGADEFSYSTTFRWLEGCGWDRFHHTFGALAADTDHDAKVTLPDLRDYANSNIYAMNCNHRAHCFPENDQTPLFLR